MMRPVVAVIFCLSLGSPAQAETIFSNLGAGDTYYLPGGASVTGADVAFGDVDLGSPFTTPGDLVFDSVEVGLTWFQGTNAGDIWLMSDVNGAPGDILEAFHFTDLPHTASTNNVLATGVSTLHPLLLEGNQYWVIASASGDTLLAFNQNTTDDKGLARRQNGGPWQVGFEFSDFAGAFRVNGSPVTVPPVTVPEPTSIVLLGTGAVALIRRRAKDDPARRHAIHDQASRPSHAEPATWEA